MTQTDERQEGEAADPDDERNGVRCASAVLGIRAFYPGRLKVG